MLYKLTCQRTYTQYTVCHVHSCNILHDAHYNILHRFLYTKQQPCPVTIVSVRVARLVMLDHREGRLGVGVDKDPCVMCVCVCERERERGCE